MRPRSSIGARDADLAAERQARRQREEELEAQAARIKVGDGGEIPTSTALGRC